MHKVQREIILDVETTGFSAKNGDRIVEIACLEVLNGRDMGKHFHSFVNPRRAISRGSFFVHGLSEDFLQDKPEFVKIATPLCDFLGDSKIIAHNAAFDIGFLNTELQNAGLPNIEFLRIIDSLQLARVKIPGRSHSLDHLAQYFGILSKKRRKHSALDDVRILFQVYRKLTLNAEPKISFLRKSATKQAKPSKSRIQTASPEEMEQHRKILNKLSQNNW